MTKRYYIILLLLFCSMSVMAVKVVFRCDDPTVQYDSVNSRILQLFAEKEVPLSIGVRPCNGDEIPYEANDTAYLQLLRNKNFEICLHGYIHERRPNQGGHGEFGGLDSNESERRITNGMAILSKYFDTKIVTFIPPWNAYNKDLPAILRDKGFRVISGELFKESLEWMPEDVEMCYMPETLGHLMEKYGIWNAARNSIFGCKDKEAVCVVMFHLYDLQDEKSWCLLEKLLDDCKKSDKVELYTFSSLLESGETVNRTRYKANLLSGGLAKIALPKGVMHPTWKCYMIHSLNAILYVLMAIGGFIVLLTKISKRKKKRVIVTMYITGTIIFSAAWWHLMSPLKLLAIVLIIGIIPSFIVIVNRILQN